MKKFRLWVSTRLVGCTCEDMVIFDDTEVPDDWENNNEFEQEMFELLSGTGMFEWGFEEIDE